MKKGRVLVLGAWVTLSMSLTFISTSQGKNKSCSAHQCQTVEAAAKNRQAFFETCRSSCGGDWKQIQNLDLHSQLSAWSSSLGENLFVIVDGAAGKAMVRDLFKSREREEYRSLFAGSGLDVLPELSPYLVRVSPYEPFLERLIQARRKEGQSLLFFVSENSLERLFFHLHGSLHARIPQDDRLLNFRVYAPEVLRAYLDSLTSSERNAWLGPIKRAAVLDPALPHWWTWQNTKPEQAPALTISERQMDAFRDLSKEGFKDRAVDFLKKYFAKETAGLSESGLKATVERAMEQGRPLNITSERDVIGLAVLMAAYKVDLSREEFFWVKERLTQREGDLWNGLQSLMQELEKRNK